MSKSLTEARLYEALSRLLEGEPRRVKSSGRLTLNKINNEAGLGHSYIHKFPDFIEYAKPIIEDYKINHDKSDTINLDVDIDAEPSLSKLDELKVELARERKLKDKYRVERDNAVEARKMLEAQYADLMFRTLELQEEIVKLKPVVYI